MKKVIFCTAIILLFCINTNAKIWRVNNNPGVTADFTTAQAANDAPAVMNGDTIHLEPSLTYYGGLSTNKRLVWISTGDFLTENTGNQFSNTPGKLNFHIYINPGSEGSVFSIIVDPGSGVIYIGAPSITLLRCKVNQIDINAPNAVVSQCFFYIGSIQLGLAATNVLISNNNIYNPVYAAYETSSAVITNNIFRSFNVNRLIYNAVIQNNICIGSGTWTFYNSTVSYNMSSSSNLPTGNFNQVNIPMTDVFVNWNGTDDNDFILKPGSPAIGAGFGGTDMGVFGGNTPYKLALQPAVPAITELSVPASNNGNTIQVTFSAKSNN